MQFKMTATQRRWWSKSVSKLWTFDDCKI